MSCVLKVVRRHQHAKFEANPMCSLENAQNLMRFVRSKLRQIRKKLRSRDQTVVSSEGDQGTCKIWGYFFPISSQDNALKHFGWTVSRSHIPFWFENFIRISYSLETKRPPLLGTKRTYALGRFSTRFCQVVSWLKIVIIVVLNILNWYRGVILL